MQQTPGAAHLRGRGGQLLPSGIWRPAALCAALSVVLSTAAARASGVDPTRISLPKGPGSIEGLATADLSPSMATGSASYEIPIAVPPASAGFGPRLALAYDSGGGLTEVGIGWRIGGVPKIRRRTQDGLPRFDATDRFEMVGLGVPSALVEVAPDVFRPSIEDGSFVRLERSEDGGTWEARTKAGPILVFGGDGFVEAEGKHVAAYLLREEHDRHGHTIAYDYDVRDGHALPSRVEWNRFDAASANTVQFDYESRPDPHHGYASGIAEGLTRRLRSVTVLHGAALVRRYELSYGTEAHPSLHSVDLVGSDGTSRMPDSRFGYSEGRLATGQTSASLRAELVTMKNAPGQSPADADVSLSDLNGDGLPDLLVAHAGRYRSYINDDGGEWRDVVQWGDASPSVSLSAKGVQLADLDADGAADLVVKSGTDVFRYFPRPEAARFGAPVTLKSVPGFSFEDEDVRLADMDGDRRTDVVMTTAAGIAVGYNLSGADWTEPSVTSALEGGTGEAPRFSDGHTSLCDVNGDRVLDLCSLRSGGMEYWLGRGRGMFEPGASAKGVPDFEDSAPYHLVDLDGDGWVDLVRVGATQVDVALAVGEGRFGSVRSIDGVPARSTTTVVEFADMNGSGTTDIVWVDVAGDGAAAWRYLELFPDGRAGLLTHIDNGLGKTQTIEYATAASYAAHARDDGHAWSTRANVAIPVVARTSIDFALGDPSVVTEWSYRDGAYDANERTFAGFAAGTRRQLGDESTPTLLTDQTFDTGLVHRELRGAPISEETHDESGRFFSRTRRAYTSRVLDQGMNGETTSYSFQSSQSVELTEGDEKAPRTLLTETEQDEYGDVTEQRSWGEVMGKDRGATGDEAFTVRTYAYDAREWLLGFVVSEELTDAAGKRVSMSRRYYDGDPMRGLPLGQVVRGDVSREEAWVGPNEQDFELVNATRYDADGLPIETEDGRGGGRYFEWASDHTTIRSERVKLDGVTLIERAEAEGAFGSLLAATDYAGQTTRYEYDPFGRLTKVIKPGDSSDLPTVSYSYDARAPLSRIVTESRVRSGESATERSEVLFDGGGRRRGTLTHDGDRWILAGVSLYDARGGARRALLPRGVGAAEYASPPLLDGSPRGSDTFHDALGREIRTRSPSGIESRTEYAPLETRHFDGGQTNASSPYEHTPVIERKDGLGRVVEHVRTLSGMPIAARYSYDAAGALLSRTDPEGNVARYEYDGRGRRIVIRDPDLGQYRLVYDATGNVIERRSPDGVVAAFRFDLAGRLLAEDWDGDGTPELTRVWDSAPDGTADASYMGRLSRMVEPSGSVEQTYDERGRSTATRYEIDGVAYVTRSEYDAQDREVRHIYPDGSSIDIHRNPRGQISGYGAAVEFTFADDGLEVARKLSTGASIRNGYDDDRRRRELVALSTDGTEVEHLRWSYDDGGNLVRVEDLRARIAPDRDRSERYEYDNLYRLVGVTGAWGRTSYRYSPNGNLLGRTSTIAEQTLPSVTYGERPHLPVRMGARVIESDPRGRMTGDGVRDYAWNGADQLVNVSEADGASVDSVFGADGVRRIRTERRADGTKKTTHFIDAWTEAEDGQLVRYIVHAGQRIVRLARDEEIGGDGQLSSMPVPVGQPPYAALFLLLTVALVVARFFARRARLVKPTRVLALAVAALGVVAACTNDGPAGSGDHAASHPVARKPGLEIRELDERDTFIVTDLLGSVLAETTTVGAPKAAFATYPFGAARYDTSQATWKYARSPRDGAVTLDHMGARFYAPDLGIWTSADPLALTDPARLVTADFGAANPYVYANQTPLIAADRDGHFWHIVVGAAAGGLFGGISEGLHQYWEHGRIDDWGKIGSAAAGGVVQGAITAAFPGVAMAGVGGAAGGITRRLIDSHGKSAGTLREVGTDAVVSMVFHGVNKAVGGVTKAAPRGTSGVERVAKGGSSEGTAAIKVTEKGLARIENHLGDLKALDVPENAAMIARLRAGGTTAQDTNFYMHELKESTVMRSTGGYGVYDAERAAHLETLKWQGIPYAPGYESQLYHPEVIEAFKESFNPAAWPK